MSVVIIGGNERMVCQYTDICKDYGCKAKVFPKEHGSVKKKIGNPDLMILFTNTVSHKMVITASQEAKKNNLHWITCGICGADRTPLYLIKTKWLLLKIIS